MSDVKQVLLLLPISIIAYSFIGAAYSGYLRGKAIRDGWLEENVCLDSHVACGIFWIFVLPVRLILGIISLPTAGLNLMIHLTHNAVARKISRRIPKARSIE